MDGLKTKQRVSDEELEECIIRCIHAPHSPYALACCDLRDARADLGTALARVAELEALLGQARDALEPFDPKFYENIARFRHELVTGALRTASRVHAALSEELNGAPAHEKAHSISADAAHG